MKVFMHGLANFVVGFSIGAAYGVMWGFLAQLVVMTYGMLMYRYGAT